MAKKEESAKKPQEEKKQTEDWKSKLQAPTKDTRVMTTVCPPAIKSRT